MDRLAAYKALLEKYPEPSRLSETAAKDYVSDLAQLATDEERQVAQGFIEKEAEHGRIVDKTVVDTLIALEIHLTLMPKHLASLGFNRKYAEEIMRERIRYNVLRMSAT